jgi:hypothetical protein
VNPINPKRRSSTKPKDTYPYMYDDSIALFSVWVCLYTYLVLASTQNSETFQCNVPYMADLGNWIHRLTPSITLFRADYALLPLFHALYAPASTVLRSLHPCGTVLHPLQYRQFCLHHLHVSVSVISASDECPQPVDPFRQWTHYLKALHP